MLDLREREKREREGGGIRDHFLSVRLLWLLLRTPIILRTSLRTRKRRESNGEGVHSASLFLSSFFLSTAIGTGSRGWKNVRKGEWGRGGRKNVTNGQEEEEEEQDEEKRKRR